MTEYKVINSRFSLRGTVYLEDAIVNLSEEDEQRLEAQGILGTILIPAEEIENASDLPEEEVEEETIEDSDEEPEVEEASSDEEVDETDLPQQ